MEILSIRLLLLPNLLHLLRRYRILVRAAACQAEKADGGEANAAREPTMGF